MLGIWDEYKAIKDENTNENSDTEISFQESYF